MVKSIDRRAAFAAAICVATAALPLYADVTALTWNGADGAAWTTGENWLDGETPAAWTDGASAVFPADATVELSGPVTVSNLTTAGALTITGEVATAHSGFLNGSTAVLVFPGCTMDDIDGKPIFADLQGGYLSGNSTPAGMYFWRRSGTTATAQFQGVYNSHLRCIKVTFSEGADGIYAKAGANSYLVRSSNNGASCLGRDIDAIDHVETYNLTTTANGSGLGIRNVRRYGAEVSLTGTVALGTVGNMDLTNALFMVTAPQAVALSKRIRGAGALVVKGLSDAAEITYGKTGSESGAAAAWLTSSGNALPNVMVSQMIPVRAVMRGNSIGADNSCLPYHVEHSGTTMTLQFQFSGVSGDNTYIKGCKVQLTQNGADVTAKWVESYYHPGGTLGEDMETADGVTKYTKADAYTGNGLKNMTFRLLSASLITKPNFVQCTRFWIDKAQIVFYASSGSVYSPAEEIAARNGSQVVLAHNLGGGNYGSGMIRRFESGSSLVAFHNLATLRSAHYIFDASTLYTPTLHATWKDGSNYFDYLTLRNGARAVGYPLRCGNLSSMTYRSEGTGTNRIETGICLYHGAASTLSIETDADLEISGKIYDAPDSANKFPQVVKSGAATLTLSGESTFTGRLTVRSGTLALGTDTALSASAPLTLSGGTVTCGATTNATGALTLSGNATIDVGDGAISFADSHAETWAADATLNIVGTGKLPGKSVRFGTNGSGLTSTQLKQIRYNGDKVSLTAQGYLGGSRGLIIMVL